MKSEIQSSEDLTSTTKPAVPLAPAAQGKKRILLADDSPQIRESLGKLLRNSGYHVTLAAHGGHVLDLVLNGDFDLLVLDLNMPEMDGWDALDRLATMKPSLPVIIITAQPDQAEWAKAEGARALMEKPLDLTLLLKNIREHTVNDSTSSEPAHDGSVASLRFTSSAMPAFESSAAARRTGDRDASDRASWSTHGEGRGR